MELLARAVVSVDSGSGDRKDETNLAVKFLVCSVISDWLMLILPENFIKFQKNLLDTIAQNWVKCYNSCVSLSDGYNLGIKYGRKF